MKTNIKNLKLKVKRRNPKDKGFNFHTMVLSFSLCVFCLSVSPGRAETSSEQPKTNTDGNITTNLHEKANNKVSQNTLFIAQNPNTPLARQLWQSRITVPKKLEESKSKKQLQRLIEQIRSVRFEPQDKGAKEPLIALEPAPKPKPGQTVPEQETTAKPEPQESKSEQETELYSKSQKRNRLPYGLVTDETLQIVGDLLQHPEQLKNPLELGDVLFLTGYLKEAAKCYQQAFDREKLGKGDSKQDTAWILFQLGNCLSKDTPEKALDKYRHLLAEYPDSLWVDLAKVKIKLTDWRLKDKPRTLIGEHKL